MPNEFKAKNGVITPQEITPSIVSQKNANIAVLPNGTGKVVLSNQTWPSTDGTTNQVLQTNGSGILSWGSPRIVTTITAGEALSLGDFVNVYNDAGTAKVRKAIANITGKEAHGFVVAAVSSGSAATVYFSGINNNFSGLTPGIQYLSAATAGQPTATPPAASGNIVQKVGVAVSPTAVVFNFGEPIGLA
jgi:hypothetical protein